MDLDIDTEAQQVALQPDVLIVPEEEVGGSETHEMATFQPYTSSVTSLPLPVSTTGQGVGNVAQSVVSLAQAEAYVGDNDHEINIDESQRDDVNDATSDTPQAGLGWIQAVGDDQSVDSSTRHSTSDAGLEKQPEERRLIGDFDGSANALWTLYGKEAKSYDDARINTLKYDMDGVLIFAGLFSAALTTFVNDSKENLQVNPQDEIVYYLRQHSTILAQISQQLSSISPQVSIPSTPPPPFPEFNPSPSDIRINILWFTSLIFSLIAALLAILVQRWVRDYMHVFQRYSDPLKSARLHQYLYEGSEGWYMPVVAEAVPGFLHLSLFLFFAGLVDSLLRINATVALSTVVPIGVSGLLYFLTIFAPISYPQSPYQNTFSGIFWYLFQKCRGRRYKDRGPDGGMKSVSTDMTQGRMQLAMDETEERKNRDVRAILRLVDNLTEDAEMEQFLMTIPGSFNTNWGAEVWKKVGNMIEEKAGARNQNEPVVGTFMDTTASTAQAMPPVLQPSRFESVRSSLVRKLTPRHTPSDATTLPPIPYSPNVYPHPVTAFIQGEDIVHGLSSRVARFLETCKNRGLFASDDSWQRRTRACIETTASLILCANAKLAWFGDITKLLEDIGSFEKTRELSEKGMDQSFVMRWSCLSLVAIRKILEDDWEVRSNAGEAAALLAKEDNTGNNQVLTRAQKADKTLQNATKRLNELYDAIYKTENLTEAKEILRDHESEISDLEKINIEADSLEDVDRWMSDTQFSIAKIISQFPGIRDSLDPASIRFSHFVKQFRDPGKVQFIRPRRTLKSLCCIVPTLRDILAGQGDFNAYQDMFNDLKTFVVESRWQGTELQRQLWRMQDLRDGSGFGFTIELFFLALQQLLSTSSSPESHSTLYMGTFRAITSDWSKYKDSLGTQRILLDIVVTRGWEFDLPGRYPAFIANEFLVLLAKVFEGQAGLHIDEAVQCLSSLSPDTLHARPRKFTVKALTVITRALSTTSAHENLIEASAYSTPEPYTGY